MAVFTVHAKNESIIVQRSMQANKNSRKKHPFAGYPAVKHPKHNKFTITDIRIKPVNFFIV